LTGSNQSNKAIGPLLTGEKGSSPGFSKNSTIVDQLQLQLFEKGAKKLDQTGPEGTTLHCFGKECSGPYARLLNTTLLIKGYL
jgi:hypothetical protein